MSLQVRNLLIGEERTKICVPLVGETQAELLEEARYAKDNGGDLVEWRLDFLKDSGDSRVLISCLRSLRTMVDELPILLTYRTEGEGGKGTLQPKGIKDLFLELMQENKTDLVDLELAWEEETLRELVREAHRHQHKVVLSHHDWEKTPIKEDLTGLCHKMADLGADLSKLAVMARSNGDLLTVLETREELRAMLPSMPVLLFAMGTYGLPSRIFGGAVDLPLTFAAGKRSTAPGQINLCDLRSIHEIMAKQTERM